MDVHCLERKKKNLCIDDSPAMKRHEDIYLKSTVRGRSGRSRQILVRTIKQWRLEEYLKWGEGEGKYIVI
jgi:hypothetical protein